MKTVLNVNGMMCEHCVKAVKGAVGKIEGVNDVSVDLEAKTVTIDYDDTKITPEVFENAIDEQGYEVVK